jgi:oxygen-independent coproporphyrinogen-3 oxidase
LFNENDLPNAEAKLALYLKGKELLTEAGYVDIGMDHFALPEDDLYKAWLDGTLHRNFMGYTTQKTSLLLGLGVSSISDVGIAFAQNKKDLHGYYEHINKGELAVTRGYFLDEEDVTFRKYILDVSCRNATVFNPKDLPLLQEYTFPELAKLEDDNLVEWSQKEMTVTSAGRHFIRNICRAFDLHLLRNQQAEKKVLFSKAI